MKKLVVCLVLFFGYQGAWAGLSPEEVKGLALRFFPKNFRECQEFPFGGSWDKLDEWEDSLPRAILGGGSFVPTFNPEYTVDMLKWRLVNYLEFRMPNDPDEYLLLCYNHQTRSFWLLLSRPPRGDWRQVQWSEGFLYWWGSPESYAGGDLPRDELYPWLADVDGDGVDEVLMCVGGICGIREKISDELEFFRLELAAIMVYKVGNKKLHPINPVCTGEKVCPVANFEGEKGEPTQEACGVLRFTPEIATAYPLNEVHMRDLDGDGVGEIVAPHHMTDCYPTDNDPDCPEGQRCRGCKPVGTLRVYKLIKGRYALWREFQHTWQFVEAMAPKVALGVTEPASLTTKELENAQGSGMLRVFVSMPSIGPVKHGEVKTVDDYQTDSFREEVGNTRLVFAKRWQNKKYPGVDQANEVVDGVWVKLAARQQCSVWQVTPSEPGYPHPEQCVQYAFVGDYLEFRLPLGAVREYLLSQAKKLLGEKAGEKGPELERDRVFVRIPVVGKMKDGRPVEVHALIEIRKVPVGM